MALDKTRAAQMAMATRRFGGKAMPKDTKPAPPAKVKPIIKQRGKVLGIKITKEW